MVSSEAPSEGFLRCEEVSRIAVRRQAFLAQVHLCEKLAQDLLTKTNRLPYNVQSRFE